MFKCQSCLEQIQPNQPEHHVVTERRQKTYPPLTSRDGRTSEPHGWEIVTQIRVCPKCFELLTNEKAQRVELVQAPEFQPKPHFQRKPQPHKKAVPVEKTQLKPRLNPRKFFKTRRTNNDSPQG